MLKHLPCRGLQPALRPYTLFLERKRDNSPRRTLRTSSFSCATIFSRVRYQLRFQFYRLAFRQGASKRDCNVIWQISRYFLVTLLLFKIKTSLTSSTGPVSAGSNGRWFDLTMQAASIRDEERQSVSKRNEISFRYVDISSM